MNFWSRRILNFLFLSIGLVLSSTAIAHPADGDGDGADENTGAIRGVVTTTDAKPATDVSVIIKTLRKSAETNENGQFIFRNLQPGTYNVEVSLIGYETQNQEVVVAANKTVHINIQLKISEKQLQDVSVTGVRNKFTNGSSDYVSKMPLKNLENPQVYTTVTKDLMKQQMVFSVDDAMKNAPGLQKMWEATGRGGDGGSYYNSRGFTLQSQLRNGIAGNVSSRIDAANLERIEVIKGPSATLFGSTLTSYGGLINRVTKKPYERFGGEISYSSGTYGFNRLSADINTPLDSAKKILLRVNAAYNYEGSFQDAGFNKSVVVAPSLSYKVSDKLSFQLDAELFSGTNTGNQIFFFYYPVSQLTANRADKMGLDYKRSYFGNDLTQASRNNNFFGQMNYKLSDKWTSQTVFTSTYSFSNGRSPYFFLMPNSVVTGDASAKGSDYLSRGDQSTANSMIQVTEIQQNFNGEFNIGSVKNRVLAGLDYFRQNSNQLFYSINTFDIIKKNGTIPNYYDFNKTNLDSAYANRSPDGTYPVRFISNTYSAYVSDVINVTDRLIAMAAVRVDYFDNKGNYDGTTGEYSGGYNQTAFSPKFGLIYQPVKNVLSLFANYQNGFTNKTGVDYQQKTFKPEQANQIEAGVKLNAYGGRLVSTLSYYDIKVKDVVRTYTGPGTFPNALIQDGVQLSKGFEAEVIANPFQGFNVVAGFSYNDSKMDKADEDVQGLRPVYSMSPYAANLWASYRFSIGKLQGLGFGFGGNYASDNLVVNSKSMGQFTLPAYTVLNATVFYEHPKFRVGLKMDNITNQEYWIGYGTMNPQKLRSVVGSVAFKF